MEVSKYVGLSYVNEYLENEIKEISQRWAGFMINKIALERILAKSPSVKALEDFGTVESEFKEIASYKINEKLKQGQIQKYLGELEQSVKDNYEKVKAYKESEGALENAEKGLQEFCEFLEVATELQKELQESRYTEPLPF
jgi:hypothetical protein